MTEPLVQRRSVPDAGPVASDDFGAEELLAMALESRINRVARDLARDTGKPVRHWLEQAAKMLCTGDHPHLIVEVEGGPMFALHRPYNR